MLINSYLKAFTVFGLTLITVNAFCFINRNSVQQKYVESVFETPSNFSLIAENLQLSNAKEYIESSFDPLTLQIYLSDISGNQHAFLPHNSFNRTGFFYSSSDSVSLPNLLQILAISSVYNGNLQIANKELEEALTQYRSIEDAENIAVIARNLSWINFISGETIAAEEFIDIAINSIHQTSDSDRLFEYLFWKNNMLLVLGNAKQVEASILNQMLAGASRKGKLKEWECYYQLGKSYLQQQKMVQAKWFFVQALMLSDEFESKVPKIKSLLMLAKVKSKINDYTLAIQDLKRAETLSEENNKLFKIDVYRQMSAVYKALKDKNKEEYYSSLYTKMRKNYVN